jgi:hypothetical protein
MPAVSNVLRLSWREADSFISAVYSQKSVSGFTHSFYKYPGRFSPDFARASIEVFSRPGDVVVDPFVGGGTSLVESRVAGRIGIGSDRSALANFVARAKTRVITEQEASNLDQWFLELPEQLLLRNHGSRSDVVASPYTRNLHCEKTWAIRRSIERAIACIDRLPSSREAAFARCVVLRTAQWALDGRYKIPSAGQFREKLLEHAREMLAGAAEYRSAVRTADRLAPARGLRRSTCINRDASGLTDFLTRSLSPRRPTLLLTSPPYPGVHMLYHRWQVRGGRETPAPFWIANAADGAGASYYAMHSRSPGGLDSYYSGMEDTFRSLAKACGRSTTVVQLIAFSEPAEQLPRYIEMMERCGFAELRLAEHIDSSDGRLWRNVPGRKWHANVKGRLHSSQEVVLLHRPS